MKVALQKLKTGYKAALEECLAGVGEASRQHAYELVHQAIRDGLGLMQIVSIHNELLLVLLSKASTPEECVTLAKAAHELFTECLVPFEFTHRGFSENRRVLQALRAGEKRFRELADTMPQLVWTADPAGRPDYFNHRLMEFNLHKGTMPVIHQEDWPRTLEAWQRGIKSERGYEIEHRLQRADGRFRWFLSRAVPVRDGAGRVIKWDGTSTDVDDRKQAEEALQKSEARFRLLSDTAGQLLATEDPQSLINDLCRGVMEYLDCQAFFNFIVDEHVDKLRLNACAGIPEEEIRKLGWLDYGVAVCGCVARDRIRIIAEDIFHTPDVRTDLVKSYGIQAYCCHPLKAQERLIGTLSFGAKTRAHFTAEEVELMRIVADQVAIAMQRIYGMQKLQKSEEALHEANESLEQRVRERTVALQNLNEQLEKSRHRLRKLASELVMAEERERKRIAGVLHDDIAQILAAARMRLALLQGIQSDPQSKQTMEEIKSLLSQSIRETRALMNDLGNPLLFDMGLQAACEALVYNLMERHPVRIICDIRDAFKSVNPVMKTILYQLIRELLNNVVKHSHAQNAHVLLNMENGHFRVKVTDDGVGFDPRTLGVPTVEGGFGLYSIRERLISIGGSLRIESTPGTGTVVTAVIPAALN